MFGHTKAGTSSTVEAALTELARVGTDVAITELDILNSSPADYTAVVRACVRTPSCTSITSWGVTENVRFPGTLDCTSGINRSQDSWHSGSARLLWDNLYRPRPAYHAIMALPYPI